MVFIYKNAITKSTKPKILVFRKHKLLFLDFAHHVLQSTPLHCFWSHGFFDRWSTKPKFGGITMITRDLGINICWACNGDMMFRCRLTRNAAFSGKVTGGTVCHRN